MLSGFFIIINTEMTHEAHLWKEYPFNFKKIISDVRVLAPVIYLFTSFMEFFFCVFFQFFFCFSVKMKRKLGIQGIVVALQVKLSAACWCCL
jgi:hypothetical protein